MKTFGLAARCYAIIALGSVFSFALLVFLLLELQSVSDGYDGIVDLQVKQVEKAHRTEVRLRWQVQEWKNVLLRGKESGMRDKYLQAMRQQETSVRGLVRELKQDAHDPQVLTLLDEFQEAHDKLSAAYRGALETFLGSKGTDVHKADDSIRGVDRAPSAVLDRLVSHLSRQVEEQRLAQHAAVGRQRWAAGSRAGARFVALLLAGRGAPRTLD